MLRCAIAGAILAAAFATNPGWYDPARHLQDELPKLRQLFAERFASASATLPPTFADLVSGLRRPQIRTADSPNL